ncbi:MAG: hypothetical protein PVF71_03645 [Desulfobacterales bacterium]|jgi:hypothetical protein
MKMKHLAHTASICIFILCALLPGFQETLAGSQGPTPAHRQRQIATQDGKVSVSFSKGTVLILLAVGVIGLLCVRRKKKGTKHSAQTTVAHSTHGDRDKAFIDLNKQYLNLQYRITQHKFSGDTPPDGLLKEISDIERKVRLIARTLE